MKLKEIYLYNRAIYTSEKEDYIKAICTIKNIDKVVNLLDEFLKLYNLSELTNISNNYLEKLLINYFNKYQTGYLERQDFEYMSKIGLNNMILYYENMLIRNNEITKLLEIAKNVKIYNEKVLKVLLRQEEALYELYYETKDNKILNFMLDNTIIISEYELFVHLLNDDYKERFTDKLIEDNSLTQILINLNNGYYYDILKSWRKHKEILYSEDIDAIARYRVYEKKDIEFLVNKLCELKEAKYIYKFLSDKYFITSELTIEQKQKLEKALKSTENIEYNFYYEFNKNKYKLIKRLGGFIAFLNFLDKYKDEFCDEEEMEKINSLCDLIYEKNDPSDENVRNILFCDDETCKVIVKKVKK